MSHDTLFAVLQVAALIFAVCFHESAHGAVALACGDPTAREQGRISLNPLKHIDPIGSILLPAALALAGAPVFGWARPVPVSLARTRDPRRARLLISAAGPVSNLILAAGFAVVVGWLRPQVIQGTGVVLETVFWLAVFSVIVNVVLAVFNLLPIPPLDGFGVLEGLLPPRLAGMATALRRYGMLLLLVVIFSGALRSILGPTQRLLVDWLLGRP